MAMTETDIKIVIAAELKKAGFDKAQKATGGLEKSFKKMGIALASAFSAQKLLAFGKASIKAFAEDERAAKRLTNTLSNMGLAFEDPRIKKFISDLEQTSGVLDDQLRPAMQSLLGTTGSVTKSQELLTLAIDMSKQSGYDLQTVANDLAKAYVGNTKGLTKYNLGLSKTELATKSFSDVQDILNKRFAGANAAYLETYSGKVALLNVAYANMQETIGKSLVDAFTTLAGNQGIGGATTAMNKFADSIARTIRGTATLIDKFKNIDSYGSTLKEFIQYLDPLNPYGSAIGFIQQMGKVQPAPFQTGMSVSGASDLYTKQDRDRKKAEDAAKKRAKELAALQKKAELDRIKREKEAQQLKRAGTVFDMENIQIVAALQGKVTDEQRLRLVALLAINNGIAEAADKTTSAILALQSGSLGALGIIVTATDNAETVINKIIKAQTQLVLVNNGITSLPKAKNPFEDWDMVMKNIIANLDTIASKIKGLPTVGGVSGATSGTSGGNTTTTTTPSGTTTTTVTPPPLIVPPNGGNPVFPQPTLIAPPSGTMPLAAMSGYGTAQIPTGTMPLAAYSGYGTTRGINVTVYVEGSVTAEKDLTETIVDNIYQYQRSGKGILIDSVSL